MSLTEHFQIKKKTAGQLFFVDVQATSIALKIYQKKCSNTLMQVSFG